MYVHRQTAGSVLQLPFSSSDSFAVRVGLGSGTWWRSDGDGATTACISIVTGASTAWMGGWGNPSSCTRLGTDRACRKDTTGLASIFLSLQPCNFMSVITGNIPGN